MNLDYKELLDRAHKMLNERETTEDRFKIPEIDSLPQGKKTFIKNLGIIAKTLKRDPTHMMKHFIKETGVPASFDGQKLILNASINSIKVAQIYKRYVDDFVICKQCQKPDTVLMPNKGVMTMKCEACGAINPVRKI